MFGPGPYRQPAATAPGVARGQLNHLEVPVPSGQTLGQAEVQPAHRARVHCRDGLERAATEHELGDGAPAGPAQMKTSSAPSRLPGRPTGRPRRWSRRCRLRVGPPPVRSGGDHPRRAKSWSTGVFTGGLPRRLGLAEPNCVAPAPGGWAWVGSVKMPPGRDVIRIATVAPACKCFAPTQVGPLDVIPGKEYVQGTVGTRDWPYQRPPCRRTP